MGPGALGEDIRPAGWRGDLGIGGGQRTKEPGTKGPGDLGNQFVVDC